MKKLLLIALVGLIAVSCSTFDKWKTPEAANGGVPEGEKSSYLLNKPETTTATPSTQTTTVKKKKKKKVIPVTK